MEGVGSPFELGLIGAIIVALWKLLDVAKVLFLNKRTSHPTSQTSTYHNPHDDPNHERYVKETHAMLHEWDKRIDGGEFSCAWKDRDEVRDLIESIRLLTAEVKLLNIEIKRTRNGGAP